MAKVIPSTAPPLNERTAHDRAPCPTDSIFVGREQEMGALRAGLEEASSGRGQLILLAGEPGIGKTRTAHELATYARAQGAQVFTGRCYEGEGAPPFWPWVQIVRSYLRDRDHNALRADMGVGAADIAQVVTEVQERLPELPAPPTLAPEHARFRFFDSFTAFLKNVAESPPLVLILDDLHWADTPSLLLLQFLARELNNAHLLIVGTYRDVELERHHPLRQTLGELAREQGSQTILLHGLTEGDVACFMQHTTGQPPDESLVATVHHQTEGNPFFLTEVVHLLAREGDQWRIHNSQSAIHLPIPQRVREFIGRHLARLSETCYQVLTLASVIGREFSLEVLTRASALSREDILKAIEEAVAARVIVAVSRIVGQYNFSHALVGETFYSELPITERVRLHRHLGEVLEQLYSTHPEPHFAELAYHFFQAAPGDERAKAFDYAIRAGKRASALLAYEGAAEHYERALQLLELTDAEEIPHCELLLALGEAQRLAGSVTQAKETFRKAADLARQIGRHKGIEQAAPFLARAALGFATGFAGITVAAGTTDPLVVGLLEEALGLLRTENCALRVKVLGRLAMELYYTDQRERRLSLSEQAVAVARQSGDPAVLAYALNARHVVLLDPESSEQRLAVATEVLRLAEHTGDKEIALRGHMWHLTALLERGQVQAADHELTLYAQKVEELYQPSAVWFLAAWRAMRAGLAGDFALAEQQARQALAIGQRMQDADAIQSFAAQILAFRGGRGLQDIELLTKGFVEQYTAIPAWRCGLALVYADMGLKEPARIEFEYFAACNFTNIPRDANWFLALASLAQVCAYLRDAQRATVLYQLLLPYADRCIVMHPALICLGSVSRFLGLLAIAMQSWDEAQAHFEAALQQNMRMGAHPLVAHTQHDYTILLLVRNQPGDREQALALLDRVLATAQALGMDDLVRRALARKAKAQGMASAGDKAEAQVPSPRFQVSGSRFQVQGEKSAESRVPVSIFRQEGDYWTIAYQGPVFRLKHIRGLGYLAYLLRHPHKESHVLDLLTMATDPQVDPSGRTGARTKSGVRVFRPGDAGELLDPQAKVAYKQRLEELREELEEARAFNDLARATQAQQEIDFLTEELANRVGFGGQDRKTPSSAERARVNVVKGIKAALAKIADHSPLLERYLATTIKTGLLCSYDPHPLSPISWEL